MIHAGAAKVLVTKPDALTRPLRIRRVPPNPRPSPRIPHLHPPPQLLHDPTPCPSQLADSLQPPPSTPRTRPTRPRSSTHWQNDKLPTLPPRRTPSSQTPSGSQRELPPTPNVLSMRHPATTETLSRQVTRSMMPPAAVRERPSRAFARAISARAAQRDGPARLIRGLVSLRLRGGINRVAASGAGLSAQREPSAERR